MQESHPQDAVAVERYIRGMELCRRRRYAQAVAELEALLSRADTIGQVARAFHGICCGALSAEALRLGDLPAAERRLAQSGRQGGGREPHPPAQGQATGPAEAGRGCPRAAGGTDGQLGRLERLAEADGAEADTHAQLALAYWQAGRHEEAYMTLEAAFRRFGGVGALHLQMGVLLAAEGRFAEARPWLARAVEADCDNADAHYHLGLVAAAQQDPLAAARGFQRALDLRGGDLMIAYQLSLAAKAAGREGKPLAIRMPEPRTPAAPRGLRELAEYVAAEPDFLEAMLGLHRDGDDLDLPALVAGAANLALLDHPRCAELHLAASQAAMRLGQAAAAEEHAAEALAMEPSLVRARLHLAALHERAGRLDQAAAELQRAIADGADWPDVHLHAGQLLRRCGRAEEARRHLQRALQLNENYRPAAEALASLAA